MRAEFALVAGLVALLGAAAKADEAPEPDPLQVFLDDNPGVRGEDLIDVSPGDSIDRVLAFVHNPESGVTLAGLRVTQFGVGAPEDRPASELAGRRGADARGSFLVRVTQPCDDVQPAPRMQPGSWLVLRENALAAWDVLLYGADCRPRQERVEASDHEAMRVVGESVFRPLGRGRFRYGPLRYETFDEAFVAPTREATLSLLRARAAAAPSDAAVQNRLAVGLYAAGDRDAAVRRLERAAEIDPSSPDPHRNLAIAHRLRGDRGASAREEGLARDAEPPPVYVPPPR